VPRVRGETVELRPEAEAPDAGSFCDKVYTPEGLDDSVNRRAWQTGSLREVAQRKVFVGVPDRTQDIDRANHRLHPLGSGRSALGYVVHLD